MEDDILFRPKHIICVVFFILLIKAKSEKRTQNNSLWHLDTVFFYELLCQSQGTGLRHLNPIVGCDEKAAFSSVGWNTGSLIASQKHHF